MKFALYSLLSLDADALDDNIYAYLKGAARWEGDPIEGGTVTASMSVEIIRTVYCRPCDARFLYGTDREKYNTIRYKNADHWQALDYNHMSAKDIADQISNQNTAIILVSASDYIMNMANSYFNALYKDPDSNARQFMWLREYTIEEAKYKVWRYRDPTTCFSDLANLMTKIGIRTDTYICSKAHGELLDMSSEGIRKVKQRKKSTFEL